MSLFILSYKKTILITVFALGAISVMAQEEEPVSAFAKKKAANDKNVAAKRELFLEKNLGYKLIKNLIGTRFDKNGLLLNTPVSSHLVLFRGFISNNYYHQFDFVNPDNRFIVPRVNLPLPVLTR